MHRIPSIILLLVCSLCAHANIEKQAYFVRFNLVMVEDGRTTHSVPKTVLDLFDQFGSGDLRPAFKLQDTRLTSIYTFHTSSAGLIEQLRALEGVDYVEAVPSMELFYTPNDLHTNQWNLQTVRAQRAWDIKRDASDVVVAVVDDAVLITHPDLAANIWKNPVEVPNGIDDDGNGYIDDIHGYDVADGNADPNPPAGANSSHFSHGTHCAGIVSASTDNGTGIASLGFNAKIMAVKCKADNTSGGSIQAPYQGVEYAIASGADIISMSWGGGSYSITYQTLFDVAHSKGIILVAAAGNSNTSAPMYPASYNHVISVAASNTSDGKASFSNYGSTIDITAPGVDIWSTVPGSGLYDFKSGTSMACPLVSGLCALMVANAPGIHPDSVEKCLKSTATDIHGQNSSYINQLGAGRINAEQALNCTKGILNADFTAHQTEACPLQKIKLTPRVIDPANLNYGWTFTGGTPASSNTVTPWVSYATPGTYSVQLNVSNAQGQDIVTRTNYVTIAVPRAEISGNFIIQSGESAFIPVSFQGKPPFRISYTDGTSTSTISNISSNPYFLSVSPGTTSTYLLTDFDDDNCSGQIHGSAQVTVSPADSTCSSTSFAQKFTINAEVSIASVHVDQAGNSYSFGSIKNGTKTEGFLLKTSATGKMLWARQYPGVANLLHCTPASNNNDVLYGGRDNDRYTLARIDQDGNLIWAKRYTHSTERYYYGLLNAGNDEYFFGGMGTGAGGDDLHLVKIKGSDGSILWNKSYDSGDDQLAFMTSDGSGGIIASGNYQGKGAVAKIDKDGKVITYFTISGVDQARSIRKSGGYLYTFGYERTSNPTTLIVYKLDISTASSPKVVWSKKLNNRSILWNNAHYVSPNTGNIYLSFKDNADGKHKMAIISKDGQLSELAVTSFSSILRADFLNNEVILSGREIDGNSTNVWVMKREDKPGLDYCFLDHENSGLSAASLSIQMHTYSVTNAPFSETSLPLSSKAVIGTPSCICSNVSLLATKDTLCLGDSSKLIASGGARYQWLYSPGVTLSDMGDSSMWVKPTQTTQYQVVVSNCGCAPDTVKYTIHVPPYPELKLNEDTSICAGDTIDLQVASGYLSYSWSPNNLIPSANQCRVFPNTETRYYVEAFNAFGCSAKDSTLVSVSACCSPIAQFKPSESLLCTGDSVELIMYSKYRSNYTYEWDFPDAMNVSTYLGYRPPKLYYSKPGTYTIRLIVSNPCGIDTSFETITIQSFFHSAGEDTSACLGDTVQLGSTEIVDYAYRWTPTTNLDDPLRSNPKAVFLGPITYMLEVTDLVSGCKSIDSVRLTLQQEKDFILQDTTICIGDTAWFSLVNYNYTLRWSTGDTSKITYITTDSTITVEASQNGCMFTDTASIDYIDLPTFAWTSDTFLCERQILNLSTYADNATYRWEPMAVTDPSIAISDTGMHWIYVTNVCGTRADSVNVWSKNCDCLTYVPNAFSPNLDGLNEGLRPHINCIVRELQFRIYNRWGELIYESQDAQVAWDGTYKKALVQRGIYLWTLDYIGAEGDNIKRWHSAGTVHVVR